MPVFSFGNIATTRIDSTDGGSLTDISNVVTKVTFKADRTTKEVKPQGGSAVTRLVGPVSSMYTLEFAYDPTVHAIFTSSVSAATPVTRSLEHGPSGNVAGQPKETAECYIANYEHDADSDNPTNCKAELVVAGAVTYGTF